MALTQSQLGEAFVDIRARFDKFDQDLEKKKSGLDRTLGNLFAGGAVAGAAAVGAAGVAVGKFTADSIKEFTSFQQGMNEVFTLLPGLTHDAMDRMSQDTLAFAKEFGALPEQVVPALYQAISAGVPPKNVFEFLGTAQKAAVGGVTDLETSVDGISSVVNAYGKDVISAAEASDLMFTAVKLGKTNFEELSGSLFNVIPTASALGVGFGDITAALASMTAQGTPTSVATTQLRQLLVELSKEGTKASDTFKDLSGQSFADFVASGGNVQEALRLMEEHANGAGVNVSNLFSSVEAGNAALSLTGGGTETFTSNLAQMEESAGATGAAFDQMDEGLGRARERAQAFLSSIKIGVGDSLEPLLSKLVELGENALPFVEDVMEKAKPVIRDFSEEFGEKLGPSLLTILDNLRKIADALGLTSDEMSDAEALAKLLGEGFDILITTLEVVTALTEAAGFIFENFGPAIKTAVNPLWGMVDGIKELRKQLEGLDLPDWLTPGSPTPLETGLRGINDALKNLPDFSGRFGFNTPSFAGVGATGGISNSATVNIGSVSATSNVSNPVDEAIRMTLEQLRQQLRS